ncbi:MAG: sel1 repeat family protein, partial [Verrucomicrobiaceae bacterium]
LLSHPDRGGDRAEALEWLHEAAGRGNASAMVQLGFASREAQGVDLDYKAAVEWFIQAHEAGDLHAAMHVGRTFASYMDQVSDALPWLLRAAKQSNRDSYIYLAMIHDERGSDHYEPAEAVKWYQTVVAKNGMSSPRALLALARHYRDGDGVPRSKEIAKVWLGMLIHVTSASNEFRREGEDLLHQMESDLI